MPFWLSGGWGWGVALDGEWTTCVRTSERDVVIRFMEIRMQGRKDSETGNIGEASQAATKTSGM